MTFVATMFEGQEDKKCQVVRKRRLSFSKLVVETTTSSDADEKKEDISIEKPLVFDDDEDDGVVDDNNSNNHSSSSNHDPQVKKAQTFRRRRLSLTTRQSAGAGDEETGETRLSEEAEEDDAGVMNYPTTSDDKHSSPSAISPPCKLRRLSTASASSRRSSNASSSSNLSPSVSSLKTIVVHAGELLSQPPPSPALVSANRLYDYAPMARRQLQQEQFLQWQMHQQQQQQFLITTPTTAVDDMITTTSSNSSNGNKVNSNNKGPKWQKRILRHHQDDEGRLPFPRDVVGTFSCHGVEPIYETDPNSIMGGDLSRMKPLTTTIAKINQDRGGIAFPYAKCPKTALFAVYDGHGHGGELVSQFCLYEVQRRLAKHPDFMTNVEKAFKDTFLAIDAALLREPLVESVFAGSTACVALLRGNSLFLSNVGDSRAVLARRKLSKELNSSPDTITTTTSSEDESKQKEWQVIDLTVDQNPNLPHEQSRIESMGGFVSPPPEPGLSARVWLDANCSQIGLAMSRSMGDHAVKSIGVIAEPVVTRHDITQDDEFFIVASDGVWEFISSEEAVQVVADHLDRGATKACQALIEAAAAKWHDEEGDYRDDITAMVIRIPDLWTYHQHQHNNHHNQQRQQQQQHPIDVVK